MTKDRLRTIIGENIRSERMARNFSIDELAELLELTPGFVGLIERGQRGTTPSTLFKLADVFGMSIDALFYHNQDTSISFGEEYTDDSQIRRKKISSLISDFTNSELDFVITTLKGIRGMNRSKAAEDCPQDSDL